MDTLKTVGDDAELYKAVGHILVKKSKSDVFKRTRREKRTTHNKERQV